MSRFYGIVIRMYLDEHGIPHFHARYAGKEAKFAIESADLIEGRIPRRAERLVREWAAAHKDELMRNWERARASKPLEPIDPLP